MTTSMTPSLDELFSEAVLNDLMPPERADEFFDAMYGDAAEGAYDIRFVFSGHNPADNTLSFEFRLHERPGKCLACNLTYGLPEVFSRHPLLNVKGVVAKIGELLGDRAAIEEWSLGHTRPVGKKLHAIPLVIKLSS